MSYLYRKQVGITYPCITSKTMMDKYQVHFQEHGIGRKPDIFALLILCPSHEGKKFTLLQPVSKFSV